MRYEPNKAFPHPVLRPSEFGIDAGDFPGHEFQFSASPEIEADKQRIRIDATFDVGQVDIRRALSRGKAEFSVLILCPKTYFRAHATSSSRELVTYVNLGDVDDQVELQPSIVVPRGWKKYRPDGLHDELRGEVYRVRKGGLLAQCGSSVFPASREFMRRRTSFFRISEDTGQPLGILDIVVGDPVQLKINPADNANLSVARSSPAGQRAVMNSVYLPAVISMLGEAIRLGEDEEDSEWFRVTTFRLAEVDIDWDDLRDGKVSLWRAAQALLDWPARYAEVLQKEPPE